MGVFLSCLLPWFRFVELSYLTPHLFLYDIIIIYRSQISYQIVLEFYLDDDEENSHAKNGFNSKNETSKFYVNEGKKSFRKTLEPFTWNLPIDINIRKYPLDTVSEINSCFDPVTEIVQNFP